MNLKKERCHLLPRGSSPHYDKKDCVQILAKNYGREEGETEKT